MAAPAPSPVPARPGLRDAVAALRYRNFALFWVGALLSGSGTWIQLIAVGYVVYEQTGSAVVVSIVGFLQYLPIVVMGPWGGSVADRYNRRTVLLIGHVLLVLLDGALWLLWIADRADVWVIVGMVLITGFVNGAFIPSWQAFVSDLVPREALLNAVTLNSTQFNAARAFGPALGGVVLAAGGAGAAFLINTLSFGAVIVALLLIRIVVPVRDTTARRSSWRSFVDAVRYGRERPGILTCFIVVTALGLFGSPFQQLLPVFAGEVFHVTEVPYGLLQAGIGIGAVIAAPLLAGRGTGVRRSRIVEVSMVAYGGAIIVFAATSWYVVAMLALLIAGAGYLGLAATLNTTIQLQVDETMRGKVLSLYVMLLTASLPIGLLVQAGLVALMGPQVTTMFFGLAFLAVFVWARFGRGHLAHLDDELGRGVPAADVA